MLKESNIDFILKWIIILLGLIIVILMLTLPKEDCEVCNFNGLNGAEYFGKYSEKCLKEYSYGQDNPNMPTLNITNLNLSTWKNLSTYNN